MASTFRPTADPDPLEVAARVRLSVTRLARILRQQAELGLTPTQITSLATIAREGPLTLGALAATEHITPPSVTKVVEGLEMRGLIERLDDASDGRRVLVSVTQPGRALLAEGKARKDAILGTRIERLDQDQLARLANAVDVLEILSGTD